MPLLLQLVPVLLLLYMTRVGNNPLYQRRSPTWERACFRRRVVEQQQQHARSRNDEISQSKAREPECVYAFGRPRLSMGERERRLFLGNFLRWRRDGKSFVLFSGKRIALLRCDFFVGVHNMSRVLHERDAKAQETGSNHCPHMDIWLSYLCVRRERRGIL